MTDPAYALRSLAAMAAATYATRLLPFLLPKKLAEHPRLRAIEAGLPPAVMPLLVLYCLKDVNWAAAPHGAPELFSVALVVVLHLWRRSALLSVGLGTACYMLLVHL